MANANSALAGDDSSSSSKGDTAEVGTADGAVTVELTTVDGGSSSLVGDDDIAGSSDACVGPAKPHFAYSDPPRIITELRATGKNDKDGKAILKSFYLRTEQTVTVSCNGSVLRVYTRCIEGECPVPKPQPVPEKIILAQIGREVLKLQKPQMSLFPKPSLKAPLPGVGFFYGIARRQFDTIQPIYLTACGGTDCVSVFVAAKPDAVYFDPGDGTPKRVSCRTDGPFVSNKVQADRAGTDCMVRYGKAGRFPAILYLHYRVAWRFLEWTRTDSPLVASGVRYATTSQAFPMTVHERQPVVVG